MKETKLVVFTKEKYMDNKPVVQLVHSTDYGIKTLRLWIDGGMTIGADKVHDDERDAYLNHFGSDAARNKAIDIWNKAMDSIMSKMTKESPCVIQMIEDVRVIYEDMEDGSGRSDNISIDFISSTETFLVAQDAVFQNEDRDGSRYWEQEPMWHKSYSWNEMTMWCFANRPFRMDEFKLHNEQALKQYYVNDEDAYKHHTIEEFVRFAFNNPAFFGVELGYCHGDLGHKLF